jgi:2'-5' RNA ligase
MSASQVRTFVAVPLPAGIQAAIQTVAQDLSPRFPDIKWTPKPENLHVTLRFLGQVDEGVLGRFAAALVAALGSRPGFEIELRGLGAFPSTGDARVVWVGVEDPSRSLADVADIVGNIFGPLAEQFGLGAATKDAATKDADKTSDAGPPPHRFRAHVTIGRTARRAAHGVDVTAALESWSDRAFGKVSVRQIHVYESITGGDASTYVLRGTAMLQPS